MTSFPVDVLIGIAFGLLVGIVPAFLVGIAAFTVEYRRRRAVPRVVAIGVAVAIAAGYGYAIGVVEPSADRAARVLAVVAVVSLLALYANSQGARLGSSLSREISQPTRRERTLSAEAIDAVDGIGHVTIRSTGEVRDVEGFPPLTPALRDALGSGSWRLPADLPLPELETRLADRLRTRYDLATVSVSIDGRGRASIAAAPPTNGIAGRVPPGWRAVSLSALLPTGLAPGDEVLVTTDGSDSDAGTTGIVLSATKPGDGTGGDDESVAGSVVRPDGQFDDGNTRGRDPVATDGGAGRITVAVPTTDAGDLLSIERGRVVVVSRDTSHEFEALSHLEASGRTVRKVNLTAERRAAIADVNGGGDEASGGDGADDRGGERSHRGADPDIHLLAVKRSGVDTGTDGDGDGGTSDWVFDPDEAAIDDATEAFVVGRQLALNERFGEPAEVAR